MEDVPFCERNIKRWVTMLILLGLLVLGYAIWSAADGGHLERYRNRIGAGRGPAAAGQMPQAATATPQMAQGHRGMPAAQPVAMAAVVPVAQAPQMAPTAPPQYPQPIDAVTRATPQGGIQFIGNRPPMVGQASDFNLAADVIRPCVVNVNAVRPGPVNRAAMTQQGAQFIDPFDGVPDKMIGQMAFESVGSGVIVDPAGYIVTNHHVVAGATAVVVTLFNHAEGNIQARIVATDFGRDLALLKIQGDGPYPAAQLADSSQVEVGDWVLAVGNPFGLEHTVTAGIISGKRSALNIGGVNYRGLLQTDAPINKGSSGGPLVNLQGEVIGINTAIYAPTGVFNGTGFAIPSNRVGNFVSRHLTNNMGVAVAMQTAQPAVQPQTAAPAFDAQWLGIGAIDMTPDLATKLKYPHSGGVYVASLILDSPADEAEILRGDIITAVADKPVDNNRGLQQIVSRFGPGQTVPITIWRGGKTKQLSLRTKIGRRALR